MSPMGDDAAPTGDATRPDAPAEPTASPEKAASEAGAEEMEPEVPRDPERAQQLIDSGVAAAEEGHWQRALKELEQACAFDPDNIDAHYNLGVLLGTLVNEDIRVEGFFEDRGDDAIVLDKAIAAYERALEVDPDYVPALNNVASHYAVRGQTDLAVERLKHSIEIEPDQPDIRDELASLSES